MAGSLTHAPSHILQRLLILLGVATDPLATTLGAWPVYEDMEPASPDNVITVYNTTPRVHGRTHPAGTTQQHYGFQVRIRGTTAPVAWLRANTIAEAFDGQYQSIVTIAGTEYVVHAVHHNGIVRIGKNVPTDKRSLYTMNPLAVIKQL